MLKQTHSSFLDLSLVTRVNATYQNAKKNFKNLLTNLYKIILKYINFLLLIFLFFTSIKLYNHHIKQNLIVKNNDYSSEKVISRLEKFSKSLDCRNEVDLFILIPKENLIVTDLVFLANYALVPCVIIEGDKLNREHYKIVNKNHPFFEEFITKYDVIQKEDDIYLFEYDKLENK